MDQGQIIKGIFFDSDGREKFGANATAMDHISKLYIDSVVVTDEQDILSSLRYVLN